MTTMNFYKNLGYNFSIYEGEEVKEINSAPTTKKIVNTKLASLPSTGGIGTTIFTIGGCVIMIAAAALFFVNRRKSEEN